MCIAIINPRITPDSRPAQCLGLTAKVPVAVYQGFFHNTRHLRLARCMLGFGALITKNGCTCRNRQRHTVQGAGSSHCTSRVRAALSAGYPLYLPISTSLLTIKSAARGPDVHYGFLVARAADVSFALQLRTQCRGAQDPLAQQSHTIVCLMLHEKTVQRTLSRAVLHSTRPGFCLMRCTEKPPVSSG